MWRPSNIFWGMISGQLKMWLGRPIAIVLSPPPHPGGGEEGDHSPLTIMLRVSELYLAAGVNNPYDSMYTGVFLSKTGLSTRGKIIQIIADFSPHP